MLREYGTRGGGGKAAPCLSGASELAATTAESPANCAGLQRRTATRGAAHTRRRRPTSRGPSREFIRLERWGWALSGWAVSQRAVVCVRGAPSARLGSHLPPNCWGRLGCRGFQARRRRLLVGRVNPPLAATTAENPVNRAGLPRHTTICRAEHTRRRRPTSRGPSREFIRLDGAVGGRYPAGSCCDGLWSASAAPPPLA